MSVYFDASAVTLIFEPAVVLSSPSGGSGAKRRRGLSPGQFSLGEAPIPGFAGTSPKGGREARR